MTIHTQNTHTRRSGISAIGFIIIGFASLLIIGLLYYALAPREKTILESPAQSDATLSNTYITIEAWGVRIPKTTYGKYSLALEGTPLDAFGANNLQSQQLVVTGFTNQETNCTIPFQAGSIIKGESENPSINSGEINVNPVATKKLRDSWYITKGLAVDGNCFVKQKPTEEYLQFSRKFIEDFQRIEPIN